MLVIGFCSSLQFPFPWPVWFLSCLFSELTDIVLCLALDSDSWITFCLFTVAWLPTRYWTLPVIRLRTWCYLLYLFAGFRPLPAFIGLSSLKPAIVTSSLSLRLVLLSWNLTASIVHSRAPQIKLAIECQATYSSQYAINCIELGRMLCGAQWLFYTEIHCIQFLCVVGRKYVSVKLTILQTYQQNC